jgi:hypothetical protein
MLSPQFKPTSQLFRCNPVRYQWMPIRTTMIPMGTRRLFNGIPYWPQLLQFAHRRKPGAAKPTIGSGAMETARSIGAAVFEAGRGADPVRSSRPHTMGATSRHSAPSAAASACARRRSLPRIVTLGIRSGRGSLRDAAFCKRPADHCTFEGCARCSGARRGEMWAVLGAGKEEILSASSCAIDCSAAMFCAIAPSLAASCS